MTIGSLFFCYCEKSEKSQASVNPQTAHHTGDALPPAAGGGIAVGRGWGGCGGEAGTFTHREELWVLS